ncbi:MAG: 4-hydroxythreonine-4-phosphate dehydrogenase PdxA [Pseudomonadota bacterium]
MTQRPVAVSCGDPSGIGPEIAVQAWQELRASCPFVWIGDPSHLPEGTPVSIIAEPAEALQKAEHTLPVLDLKFAAQAQPGHPDPRNATGVIVAIERAVSLVQSGSASAICTAPINKKALIDGADFAYPGHTEFLAALAGCKRVVMMLASERLRVVPATIHIALSDVPGVLTPDLLRETLDITRRGLTELFGITDPRIAVAGLNPHAGEDGNMGSEEIGWITPLLDKMRGEGFTLSGPLPADTMFHASARAGYDAAVAMYHDQALIPIKTLDFDRGVNVTLGLPFVRTSPDHGTAYDIAGQGRANATSIIEALKLAARLGARHGRD